MSRRSSCRLALPLLRAGCRRRRRRRPSPARGAYVPLPCGGAVMVDAAGDTPNAAGALDLVGTAPSPAGFHAADAQFLYLRMRVAADPTHGRAPRAQRLGLRDRSRRRAQHLRGPHLGQRHRRDRRGGDLSPPDDGARRQPRRSGDDAGRVHLSRSRRTAGSSRPARRSAAVPTSFLDLAVPWTDLATVGVTRATQVRVWAGIVDGAQRARPRPGLLRRQRRQA